MDRAVAPFQAARFSVTFGTCLRLTQIFTLPVVAAPPAGGAPEISSSPTGPAFVDELWDYQVVASDPDDDPLTYSLDQDSLDRGMSIDAAGLVTWTPSATGQFAVVITVDDGTGGRATQSFTLPVAAQPPADEPPVITLLPPSPARLGEVYV